MLNPSKAVMVPPSTHPYHRHTMSSARFQSPARWLALSLFSFAGLGPLSAMGPVGSLGPLRNPWNPVRAACTSPATGQVEIADETEPKLFEVTRIIDGDTIHILRAGETDKLRLLSVDTEEKLTPGRRGSASKPQTVFGEETKLWTAAYMGQFRDSEGTLRVGLSFPEGLEERDIYGRLLCHVIMPDGTDFNLLLVELGKSPYFNKYGNSRIAHDEFVAAQKSARGLKLGIWDPTTNRPLDSDAPAAVRDYAALLPWWQIRADAIEAFRRRVAAGAKNLIAADNGATLAAATLRSESVEVFGSPSRFYEEKDGSLTVLFRAGADSPGLRVIIPADSRPAFEAFDLKALTAEFRQNYAFVNGTLQQGPRGPQLITTHPKNWRRAGPDPR